jgi:nucleoid-associated protein YgaU
MGNVERAKIFELDPTGKEVDVTNPICVCFNPKEYSLEKSISWESSKAYTDAPVPEFKAPAAMTLSVTLQFDTYEERVSVRDKYIRRLEKLTLMKSKAKDDKDVKNHAPPQCKFVWGKLHFRGVIDSLSQKYTMFLTDGTPVRAEVALKMRNVEDAEVDTGTDTKGSNSTTTRTVTAKQGDRLDLIASRELGDPSRWAEIAALNGIDDPGQDLSGKSIQIPS